MTLGTQEAAGLFARTVMPVSVVVYESRAFGHAGAALQFGVCKAAIIAQRVGALKALMQDMKQ